MPAFASQSKLVLIYRPRRDGRLSWPWVADWLHTEMKCTAQGTLGDGVPHFFPGKGLSINIKISDLE